MRRMSKTIVIVGGTGFLGRYVVRTLAQAGYRVLVLCRYPNEAQTLKTAGNLGQVAVHYGDITRIESIEPYLANAFGVVNLVGILFESGNQKFNTIHARGAEQLAQAAKRACVQAYIHMSALGVDKASGSQYARTKMLGERSVRAAFPEAVILRPSVLFGPEDNFFNQFACMARVSPALPLIGGGKTKFQPVYVGDVAEAVKHCIEYGHTNNSLYELGGPEIFTFKQILEYILRITHRNAALIRVPFGLAGAGAFFAEFLPTPPLTRDQVRLLRYHNVVNPDTLHFHDLEIKPTAVDMIVPNYLERFAAK